MGRKVLAKDASTMPLRTMEIGGKNWSKMIPS